MKHFPNDPEKFLQSSTIAAETFLKLTRRHTYMALVEQLGACVQESTKCHPLCRKFAREADVCHRNPENKAAVRGAFE